MNQFKKSIFLLLITFALPVLAEESEVHLNDLNYCKVTKAVMNNYEPEKFETSNNLTKRAGQESTYCGEKVIVHGRLLDQNCVPVSDAKIYAWQANCNEKYPYKPLRNNLDENLIDADYNLTFTGNGIATTNNKGEFTFIIVYPPSMHKKSPHLNVRVEHHRLGNLQTILTLRGKKVQNPRDNPELNSISAIAEKQGMSIYDFEVVLPGTTLKDY